MNGLIVGAIAGLGFGVFAVLIMLPMKFDDKAQALAAAFASRFAIGFIIPNLTLPMPLWGSGAIIGLIVSLSDAIVTKSYAPILILGTIGGAVIGLTVSLLA